MNAVRSFSAASSAALLLAACSGGGSGASRPAAIPATTAAKPIQVLFRVPAATASTAHARKPAYVSPATTHVQITLVSNGGNAVNYGYGQFPLTPSTPGCTQQPDGSLQCAITLITPNNVTVVGDDVFDLQMMDAGNTVLSHAAVPVTVSPTQATSLPVTLNGVVASASVSIASPTPAPGAPSQTALVVTAKDADGYTIVGPGGYETPVTLSDSDTSGATSLSTTSVTAPGQTVTLSFNGDVHLQYAIIRPSVSGANIAASKLVPDVLLPQPRPPYVWVAIHSSNANLGPYGWLVGYPLAWMLEGTSSVRPGPVIVTPGINVSKVAVDHAGNVYADTFTSGNDNSTGAIEQFAAGATGAATAQHVYTLANVDGISGFSVDPSGNVWAIGTNYPNNQPGNHPSTLFEIAAGASSANGIFTDTNNNLLNAVHGIRADGSGHAFVANLGSQNPAAPGYVSRFGGAPVSASFGDSDLNAIPEPDGLRLDAAGNVFVGIDTSGAAPRFDVFSGATFPAGPLGSVQSPAFASFNAFVFNGIDADAQGNVYAAGTSGKIVVFPPSVYSTTSSFATPSAQPITTFQCCFNPADPSGNGVIPVPAGLVSPPVSAGMRSIAVQR